MKSKNWIVLLVVLVILLVVSLWIMSDSNEQSDTLVTEQESEAYFGRLRDKNDIYKMYDPTEVVTMYLTVSTGNEAENTNHTWAEINTYSAYDYEDMGIDRYKVQGLLQVGTEDGPGEGELGYGQMSPNCTVQIRGQISSKGAQKNYKIKIKDNKGDWRGQTTIALNKHQSDGVRFRNKLAFDLMTGIDQMMSLRTTFVHLYVKDTTAGGSGQFVDYGLYTQVEQLNKTALERHGLDKNGHLYKINYFEFYRYEDFVKLKTDPTYDEATFEYHLETKGNDDHQKLINMLDDLNDYSIPIDTVLEKHFDVENLSYWLAFHILVGNVDTQSRNVYMYSPLNGTKWYFLSWDNDAMMKKQEYQIQNRVDATGWNVGVSNYWGNVLFQRALKSEKFRKELDKAVEDIKAYLSKEKITGLTQKYAAVVKPYLYSTADITYAPLTPSQFDLVARDMYKEVDLNYKLYKESFRTPQPFFIALPRKMADGKMIYEWEASYDFNGEPITYTFELGTDYLFARPILEKEGMTIPVVEGEKLSPGHYFVRVTAKNKSGKTQTAFDCYTVENGKVYGVLSFYVRPDGKIEGEVYED